MADARSRRVRDVLVLCLLLLAAAALRDVHLAGAILESVGGAGSRRDDSGASRHGWPRESRRLRGRSADEALLRSDRRCSDRISDRSWRPRTRVADKRMAKLAI